MLAIRARPTELALIDQRNRRAASSRIAALLLLHAHRGLCSRRHHREEGGRDQREQGHDGVAGGQLRGFLHVLQHLSVEQKDTVSPSNTEEVGQPLRL